MDLLLANNKIKRFYICLNGINNDFHSLYISNTNKEVKKHCLEIICMNFTMSNSSLFLVKDRMNSWASDRTNILKFCESLT